MSLTHTEVTAELEPCGKREHPDCGIRDVLDRVGDTWSVLVVVELSSGARRFGELQRAIDGISQRMLTLTLRNLERDGLVNRTVTPSIPPRVDYELTELGQSLQGPICGLARWATDNVEVIHEAQARYDADHDEDSIAA